MKTIMFVIQLNISMTKEKIGFQKKDLVKLKPRMEN